MSEYPTPISDDDDATPAAAEGNPPAIDEPATYEAATPKPATHEPVGDEVAGPEAANGETAPLADNVDADSAADAAEESNGGDAAAKETPDGTEAPAAGGKSAVLENECEIAADYLEELLDIADLDGDIETFVEGGRAHVSVDTDGKVLVGKDGEVLEALQELSRLAVMTETGHRSRLMLDVAGHRDERRQVLRDLATDAVQEVKDSGEPVRLQPMNPFERKIVHDYVADAGLVSESEGEEPRRCVVIKAS